MDPEAESEAARRVEIAEKAKASEYAANLRNSPAAGGRAATGPGWGLALLMLLVGILIGIGGATWRHHADDVVLTVNGAPITRDQFMHRMELAAGPQVLSQLVQEEKLIQFARKNGVEPTDAEIDAKLKTVSAQPDFNKNLTATRQNVADARRNLQVHLAEQAVLTKGISVSDAETKAFYALNTDPKNSGARYYQPERVQIAIVVSDRREDVEKALHDLSTGVPFPTVAKLYSKDKSAQNGGVIPAIGKGRLDAHKFPGLESQIFAMKVGDQLDHVKVAGAYWIIRCVARAPEQRMPFEKVLDECRTGALLSKGMQQNQPKMQADLNDFSKAAEIRIKWPQYADLAPVK